MRGYRFVKAYKEHHGARLSRTRGRWLSFGAATLVVSFVTQRVHAGGFELPDNGTQALGRGGAFVAKADDATAIQYNPAGLAHQHGTHFLFNGNLYLHSFEFARIGTFPDDPQNSDTPWGNAPYPVVKNVGGPYVSPFLAVTSDFNYFDRLSFAAGLFSAPMIGNRTFPIGVESKPSSSRYDFVQSRSSILYPTVSAGVRVNPWLDLGVSAHVVLGSIDHTAVSYADISSDACKNKEDFRCDSRFTLQANGTSFGATMGAMARPKPTVEFGASFRTPINITAQGYVSADKPKALGTDVQPGQAVFATQLPWMFRIGGRQIGMDGNFEVYDLELDITYEGWGSAQALGSVIAAPNLGAFKNVQAIIQHRYKNTFGLRAGGGYNIDVNTGTLSLRGGAYFDSSATDYANTRLDYDTLAKIAGTIGVGYKIGSFGFDFAYAAVASTPRLVGSGIGDVRPINMLRNGEPMGSNGKALPVVNEGAYQGFTHIFSLGVRVSIDSFFGPQRPIHYGNSYEPNYVGPTEEKPPTEEKKPPTEETEKKPPSTEEKKPPTEETEKKPTEKKPPSTEEKKPPTEETEKKPTEKKPPTEEKKPPTEEKKPPTEETEKKPTEKKPPTEEKKPPTEEPDIKKPPPPPPPKKEEKPPTKRKEWWEEIE